jgi:hypothetical protein
MKLPFNACDYRCERCLETAQCHVFRTIQQHSLLKGVDNRSDFFSEAVLDDIRESFRETEEMIKQKARELGIDIAGIAGGGSEAEIRDSRPAILDDPLYEECRTFAGDASLFLKTAYPGIREEDGEYLDDLAWHHSVVTPKIYRALGWRTDGDIALDAKNSAAVALKSLTICIMAFDYLSRHQTIAEECRRLSSAGTALKDKIKNRFQTARPA